ENEVMDLVEPSRPLGRAGLLPLASHASAVPGAGGEPEDLRAHIQSVEGGGEDVEEGAEAQRMGLHRPGEIEQKGHGAIGLRSEERRVGRERSAQMTPRENK